MMLPLIIIIVSLPQFISSSNNLALTFDAANSTCTAACSTCSDTSNTDTTTSNSNTTLLEELLNTTSNATSQEIEKINQKMDGLIASLSHIKDTTTTNAGAINDILLLVKDLLMLHNESSSTSFSLLPTLVKRLRTSNQTVLLVCIYWQLLVVMKLNMFTAMRRSYVVQEEDGQDYSISEYVSIFRELSFCMG